MGKKKPSPTKRIPSAYNSVIPFVVKCLLKHKLTHIFHAILSFLLTSLKSLQSPDDDYRGS